VEVGVKLESHIECDPSAEVGIGQRSKPGRRLGTWGLTVVGRQRTAATRWSGNSVTNNEAGRLARNATSATAKAPTDEPGQRGSVVKAPA
jgi:hypothetical protein